MFALYRTTAQVLSAGALLVAAACTGGSQGATRAGSGAAASVRGFGREVADGYGRVRAATAGFARLDSAVAAGYAREVAQCFSHPHHGAMGFHHLNRAYLDARVEVDRPEILLYERRADGRYALNGVEFIIPYRLWPRDSVAPTLMGLTLRQEDDLKLWYLHMWVWNENAAGLFADWNPAVKCPAG